jgi:hypothetical protein
MRVLGGNPHQLTLTTTIPIWSNLGRKPGRRGGKPAPNRLSYGMDRNSFTVTKFHKQIAAFY